MPKEKLPSENKLSDIETLSSHTKVRYLLEAFDCGKGSAEEIQKRKDRFMELMRSYFSLVINSKAKSENMISASEEHRAKIHNQIMEVVQNISLSMGISENQRKVADFLAKDRRK